jgi:phosphopantothenoylcysteine decarboxylase/phosphopantothenate--cysteine ligase
MAELTSVRKLDHVVLGLTGGIAAYKTAELCRLLVQRGSTVQVVMSEGATHFITPTTLQALSGRAVFTDLWDPRVDNGMAHIDLSRAADLLLVAPASADFLAKIAHGLADDLLTTLCLARDCPLLVAPAMNKQMWAHPATQRNVRQLVQDGVVILGPASGDQACGEIGEGRMLEPEEILDALTAWAQPKVLSGKRVLITAGPTFEAIDPVRGITNTSSGKMGFALARAAAEAGAQVTLIAGATNLATPQDVTRIDVVSAAQMAAAVDARVSTCDIFIAVAAVADYTPEQPSKQKIKKTNEALTVKLAPTRDILASVAKRPNPPFCVGFAAESERIEEHALAKRKQKAIPLLVANHAQTALGADDNEVILFDDAGRHPLARAGKLALARDIVAHIAKLLTVQRKLPTPA